jgi:hypothetical protein
VEKWNCYKDKVEMEQVKIGVYYLDRNYYLPGLKCPICGISYLMEQMAQQLRESEELVEAK